MAQERISFGTKTRVRYTDAVCQRPTTVECANQPSVLYEDTFTLPLAVAGDSVQAAFDASYGRNAENSVKACPGCKAPLTRYTRIEALGDYVLIQLKRYAYEDGRAAKDDSPVVPTDPLTVSTASSQTASLVLRSIVCHAGAVPTSGHYTAATKCGDALTYLYDDDRPPEPYEPEVQALQTAYLLLYKKRAKQGGSS